MSNAIESVLVETRVFQPPEDIVAQAAVSGMHAYRELYQQAEQDPEGFWRRQAGENLRWAKPFTQVLD